MSKPQKEPQRELYYRDVNFLYEVFEKFENLEDFKRFFKDLLTPTELRMVRKRWHIACLLDEGHNVRQVARQAQVSTGTVMKVKTALRQGRGGLTKALELTRPERRRESAYRPRPETTTRQPDPKSSRLVFG